MRSAAKYICCFYNIQKAESNPLPHTKYILPKIFIWLGFDTQKIYWHFQISFEMLGLQWGLLISYISHISSQGTKLCKCVKKLLVTVTNTNISSPVAAIWGLWLPPWCSSIPPVPVFHRSKPQKTKLHHILTILFPKHSAIVGAQVLWFLQQVAAASTTHQITSHIH